MDIILQLTNQIELLYPGVFRCITSLLFLELLDAAPQYSPLQRPLHLDSQNILKSCGLCCPVVPTRKLQQKQNLTHMFVLFVTSLYTWTPMLTAAGKQDTTSSSIHFVTDFSIAKPILQKSYIILLESALSRQIFTPQIFLPATGCKNWCSMVDDWPVRCTWENVCGSCPECGQSCSIYVRS